jgi:hypothetical protein
MIHVGFAPCRRHDQGASPARRILHSLAALAAVLALAVLFVPAAVAQTYSVNIHPTLNELDVKIEPISQTAMLVIKLTNATEQKVRCKLRYEASPQTPYRSSVNVGPGKTEQSVFRAQRKWFNVDVYVECEAAKG